jgi:hypothetical protein
MQFKARVNLCNAQVRSSYRVCNLGFFLQVYSLQRDDTEGLACFVHKYIYDKGVN